MKYIVKIEYCPGCKWLNRASWFAQELLTTFEKELEGVTIAPAKQSGDFNIFLNEELIFSRKENGGFIDIAPLKRMLRDKIAPEKSLGHTDKKKEND
ncbi:MAG: SelT/SelW/SelH family protein [Cytophagales bacterium]